MSTAKTAANRLLAGICLLFAASASAADGAADAGDYPNRPITIVVPYPPGGATDPIARIYSAKLSEAWKVPVIIENKAGAGTIIGMNYVARAKPDGYTIAMGSTSVGTNPALYTKLPYDTAKDFSYLSMVGILQIVPTVNPKLPVKTLADLIAYAKANPGKLNFSSAGNGTITHLAAEYFCAAAGINAVHVPYKGSAAAVLAVMTGEANFTFDTLFTEQPFIKDNRLRALASAGPTRLASMPALPTVAETFPGFSAFSWLGFMGPAGMPPAVIAKWSTEIIRIAKLPDVKARLLSSGVEAHGTTPERFAAFVQEEIVKWQKVATDAKIPKMD